MMMILCPGTPTRTKKQLSILHALQLIQLFREQILRFYRLKSVFFFSLFYLSWNWHKIKRLNICKNEWLLYFNNNEISEAKSASCTFAECSIIHSINLLNQAFFYIELHFYYLEIKKKTYHVENFAYFLPSSMLESINKNTPS